MRLCHAYCLNTGSTLAKVKPDTNVKFGEAKKIREAFSKPYPKYLLIIYSLGIKEFRYMATDIYGAQWIRYAHLPSGFSCSSYDSLSPSWMFLGHLFDLWFKRDSEWVMQNGWATPLGYQPWGSTLGSPNHLVRSTLHPSSFRNVCTPSWWEQRFG